MGQRVVRSAAAAAALLAAVACLLGARRALPRSRLESLQEEFSLSTPGLKMPKFWKSSGGFTNSTDPFHFRCPLSGGFEKSVASSDNNAGLKISWELGGGSRDEDDASCCQEYWDLQWPYQFPVCRSITRCTSCWMASNRSSAARTGLSARHAGVAWAASAAAYSHATVKKKGMATRMFETLQNGLKGDDPKGVDSEHGISRRMSAPLGLGMKKDEAADACPRIQDWEMYMLSDESDDIHARVYKSSSSKIAVVAFRGTQLQSQKNWHVDASIDRVELQLGPGEPALVHGGFLSSLQRILPRVRKWLEGLVFHMIGGVKQSWTLVFTGHSLGGALALLAASIAESQGWHRKPDYTVVFGAPRVANGVLNDWWEARGLCPKLLRVNVFNDAVHWFPSAGMIQGGMATIAANCLKDLSSCLGHLASREVRGGSGSQAPNASSPWVHVCSESEYVVPGAVRGINAGLEEASPVGGAMAHQIGNGLYGYGFGVLHGGISDVDEHCGVSADIFGSESDWLDLQADRVAPG
jgi:hypothetical protein